MRKESQTKKSEAIGSLISTKGGRFNPLSDQNKNILSKINKQQRDISSILVKSGHELESKINNLISNSERKIRFGEDILLLDLFSSKQEIISRNLVENISGIWIYRKELDDKLIGIAGRKNHIGWLSGEIIFKRIDKKVLSEIIASHNFEITYLNSYTEIDILKAKDTESFEKLLRSSDVKRY